MDNPGQQTQTQNNSEIAVDTCVLQYLNNKDFGHMIYEYLSNLIDQKHVLVISKITICELLTNATVKQEEEGIKTLNIFKQYDIDERVLVASARLSTLYKKEGVPIEQIDIGDFMIAATSILTDSMVLTANINDFPRPFFRTVDEKLVFYTKRNKQQMLVLNLLRPNYKVLEQRFSERPKG